MKKWLVGGMIVLVAGVASADTIASWDFSGFAGTEATAAGTMASGMEGSTLSHGAGLQFVTPNPNAFNGTGFLASLAASLADDDYFTFSLEASANYSFSVSSIDFSFDASGSGPQSWALFSSVDGFADAGDALYNWASVGTGTRTATLSGITELQNAFGPVEFRVYGYDASLQSGTGSFEGAGNDVTVNGTVVPEPATMGLLGLGALAMGLRRKMQK